MGVDASGRLKINMSLITGAFETLQSASGVLPTFSDYNNFYLPIEDNATITPPIPANIAKYMFVIKQSASGGGNTITFNNTIWAGGVAPMLTAASGSVDVVFLAYVPPLQKYIGDFRADWS
jgi:hypothetical protein